MVCNHMMKSSPSLIPSHKLALACAALLAPGFFSACTTSVQLNDDGTVIGEYKLGYLYVKPNQSLKRVHEAAKKAFKDLGNLQVGDKEEAGEFEMRARDSHDTSITVELKDFTTYTSVKIRCGASGNLAEEQQVYEAITRNL
jgi:hypothetical protein